ncbi:MAG: 4Fe-4S dicluster domain-containing protein [bacterium]|nr:4Fe-4S dicluster domain-containing protein [bacterium]
MIEALTRGIKLGGITNSLAKAKIAEIKSSANFCVPLKSGAGSESKPLVIVGDLIKRGTVIGAPSDETSGFVYSPCSGAVVSIKDKVNSLGENCLNVEIEPAHKDSLLYFRPLENRDNNNLFGRLIESGSFDNWGKRYPSYHKYINPNTIGARTLIVKLFDSDPYCVSNLKIAEDYAKEVALGALCYFKVSVAVKLIFVGSKAVSKSTNQKIYDAILDEINKSDMKTNQVSFVTVSKVYPNDEDHLLTKKVLKKTIAVSVPVSDKGVFIENAQTCLNFYRAVYDNLPTTEAVYTIAGNNLKNQGVYLVKNGLVPQNVFASVDIKNKELFKQYSIGGTFNGISQCDTSVGLPLSVSTLFSNKWNDENFKERDCINCGRCNARCPIKLSPMMIDNFAINKDFARAKRYGVLSCIDCGVCSYVCPAKRHLSQRISDTAQAIKQRRTM